MSRRQPRMAIGWIPLRLPDGCMGTYFAPALRHAARALAVFLPDRRSPEAADCGRNSEWALRIGRPLSPPLPAKRSLSG